MKPTGANEAERGELPIHKNIDGMILPVTTTPPEIEHTEWGGRFPGQDYFPCYLANGRDAILINFSGSGDGHWERAPYGADVLGKQHTPGWYKADRRSQRRDSGVYGPLINLGEVSACPVLRGEYVVPSDVSQYFDPRTATITTFYSQEDHSGGGAIRLRIATYLTSGGLLVQEIEVLEAPVFGVAFSFALGTASPGYQNHMVPLVTPTQTSANHDGGTLTFVSEWDGLVCHAFSHVEGVNIARNKHRESANHNFLECEQITEPVFKDQRLWRVVSFQDSREDEDPRMACAALIRDLKRSGLDKIRLDHLLEWEKYFSTCRIELPDKAAGFLLDVSRYLIKANHHPAGFQPVGLLPYQWQGVMFWDASFCLEAFLACGNHEEAFAITDHVCNLMPKARELATQQGLPGARFEWTCNLDSFTSYEPQTRQVHNNAVWARALCLQSLLSRRGDNLNFTAVEELLQFLLRCTGVDSDGESVEVVGIDESENDPKPADTWTCAILLKALQDYLRACDQCERPPGLENAHDAVEKLQSILRGNEDETGVLQSFRGGNVPHWGSLVFDMFPDHPAAEPTLAAMTRNHDSKRDLFNFHGLNRYAERAFPWSNFWFSRCMASVGRKEATSYFLHGLRHAGYFGSLSERIFYHGEHYIEWFATAHAALILAATRMLVHAQPDGLDLLPGVDLQEWPTLRFEDLHAGEGLVVSMTLDEGKISSCRIKNLSYESRQLRVRIPHMEQEREIALEPGWNELFF